MVSYVGVYRDLVLEQGLWWNTGSESSGVGDLRRILHGTVLQICAGHYIGCWNCWSCIGPVILVRKRGSDVGAKDLALERRI